jgi:hydrogenase maturation protein HypF
LARIVLDISSKVRQQCSIGSIALSGGVFQNNFLLNKCYNALQKKGFKVYSNFKVPVNDGGISLGQAYLAAYEILSCKKKEN